MTIVSYNYIELGINEIVDERDGWGILKACADKHIGRVKMAYTAKE